MPACVYGTNEVTKMIWIFERGEESLRLETRYDNETTEYVLILHHPDAAIS